MVVVVILGYISRLTLKLRNNMKKTLSLVVAGLSLMMLGVNADSVDDMYDRVEGVYKEIRVEFEDFEGAYGEAGEVMAKSFPLYHMYYKQVFSLYDRFMIRFRGYKPDSIGGWDLDDVLAYHKIDDGSFGSMERFFEYSEKVLTDLRSIAVLLADIRDKLEEAAGKQEGAGFFKGSYKKDHYRGGRGGHRKSFGRRSVEATPTYSTSFFGRID